MTTTRRYLVTGWHPKRANVWLDYRNCIIEIEDGKLWDSSNYPGYKQGYAKLVATEFEDQLGPMAIGKEFVFSGFTIEELA